MINQLREKIKSELESLSGIAEIYDGIPTKFGGFPSIYFRFDRIESSNLDSNHHERLYYFQINVFQETTTLGNIVSEKNLCEVLDSIIDSFDRSDLDGLATSIDAVGGNIQPVETDVGPALHGIVLLAIHIPFTLSL